MTVTPSINDRAIEALSMVAQMGDGMSNDDPDRHIIRNLKRSAEKALDQAFILATDLAYQAQDVRKTFSEIKEQP